MAAAKARTGPFFAQLDWLLETIYEGSGEQLAERLGVDQATVWRWRERLSHPQRANLEAIALLYVSSIEKNSENEAKPRRKARGVNLSLKALQKGKKAC